MYFNRFAFFRSGSNPDTPTTYRKTRNPLRLRVFPYLSMLSGFFARKIFFLFRAIIFLPENDFCIKIGTEIGTKKRAAE